MGMSVSITGVRDLSKRFELMISVKEACDKANIDYPKDAYDFFGSDICENREYLSDKMETTGIKYYQPPSEYLDVYEVDISELPEDVKKIRFTIGY